MKRLLFALAIGTSSSFIAQQNWMGNTTPTYPELIA